MLCSLVHFSPVHWLRRLKFCMHIIEYLKCWKYLYAMILATTNQPAGFTAHRLTQTTHGYHNRQRNSTALTVPSCLHVCCGYIATRTGCVQLKSCKNRQRRVTAGENKHPGSADSLACDLISLAFPRPSRHIDQPLLVQSSGRQQLEYIYTQMIYRLQLINFCIPEPEAKRTCTCGNECN